jgi:hypothetical protein
LFDHKHSPAPLEHRSNSALTLGDRNCHGLFHMEGGRESALGGGVGAHVLLHSTGLRVRPLDDPNRAKLRPRETARITRSSDCSPKAIARMAHASFSWSSTSLPHARTFAGKSCFSSSLGSPRVAGPRDSMAHGPVEHAKERVKTVEGSVAKINPS